MILRNLTPHALHIRLNDGSTLHLDPETTSEAEVPRVSSVATGEAPVFHGDLEVPCVSTTFGPVERLPEPVDGVILIVSGMVLDAVRRHDLAAPGASIRDGGQIVGCVGLRVAR